MQLHVVPHAADGKDVLAQREPRLDDVGLRGGVEPLELVQLLGEGEGRGGEGVVQDAVLLRHNPRQTLGQRRVRLGRGYGQVIVLWGCRRLITYRISMVNKWRVSLTSASCPSFSTLSLMLFLCDPALNTAVPADLVLGLNLMDSLSRARPGAVNEWVLSLLNFSMLFNLLMRSYLLMNVPFNLLRWRCSVYNLHSVTSAAGMIQLKSRLLLSSRPEMRGQVSSLGCLTSSEEKEI